MNAAATKPQSGKLANYAEARSFGRDAGYLANVILCHHRNPARKLAGLVRLLRAGHDCRTAQFAMDVLLIDGVRRDWSELEQAN
jgi:hypothetical protein